MAARAPFVAALLCLLAACAVPNATLSDGDLPPVQMAERPINESWRAVALAEDAARLDRLLDTWQQGLSVARARGFSRQIGEMGDLLDPVGALPRAEPPPGPYRCRVIRLGGRRAFTVYPSYFCHVVVEGSLLAFAKQDGSDRPGGYLFPDGDVRMVFLGALAEGNEPVPPAYGESGERNLVGVAERVGPMRYRIVLPSPPTGATLDVIELVPSPPRLD